MSFPYSRQCTIIIIVIIIQLNTKPWDIIRLAFIWTPRSIIDDLVLPMYVKSVRVVEAVQRVKLYQITCEIVTFSYTNQYIPDLVTCCVRNFTMLRPLIDTTDC